MTAAWAGAALILSGLTIILLLARTRTQILLWERAAVGRRGNLLAQIGGLMVFVGIWYLGHSLNPDGPTRIPTPAAAVWAAVNLLVNGGWVDVLASTARVIAGFWIAAVASIVIAFTIALRAVTATAFSPPLSFIRYIPPTAFTALLVIYFGIDELYKTAVIFVGVFFFNFRMTMDILEDFDVRYVELARLTGASYARQQSSRWLFANTVIPASSPRLWDMLRINLSFAWTFLVVAEVVGAQHGLGKELYLAQRFFRVEDVYACILLFGLIGYASDLGMALLKRVLFRWHDDATRR
ncbi:MAG: NitT/TauT family transport system permease protein [Alphaproteobacteria bacterium]|jgi:NitT/TauT family transport system permease protein|nr:NitT/TauT family transport system permease protein [Alphaproteobacteria bacterium]